MKHFLKETDFTVNEVSEVFARARRYKQERGKAGGSAELAGQSWALIFSKSSTRTRV